jgi:hypothetical protein
VTSLPPWSVALAAVVSGALLASCGMGQEPRRTLVRSGSDTVMVMSDPRIKESSGLAASTEHAGVFYTHNDRGSGPQVYAVGEDGGVQAVIDLVDAPHEDWEDMTVSPGGNVWIGDIGGSDGPGRSEVSLVWFREQETVADGEEPWLEFRLAFEDGPHDSEALLIDPRDRRKYIVTKDSPGGGIYAAPPRLKKRTVNPLERIGDAPPNITGGSFAPDGKALVLRSYRQAYIYDAIDDPEPVMVPLPQSAQGESIVLLANGDLLVGSEGLPSEIIRVEVPAGSSG